MSDILGERSRDAIPWHALAVNPQPWTAPAFDPKTKRASSNAQMQAYKAELKDWLEDLHLTPIEGPVVLELVTVRVLEQTNRGARKSRAHSADLTNVQKATEDALQGFLFKNDVQVVEVHHRFEQGPDVTAMVAFRCYPDPIISDLKAVMLSIKPAVIEEEANNW